MSRRSDSTLSDISSQSLSPRRNSLSSLINSISQVAVRKEIAERLKVCPASKLKVISRTLI